MEAAVLVASEIDDAVIEAACNLIEGDYPELKGVDFEDAAVALFVSGGVNRDVFGDGLVSFTGEAVEGLRVFVETVLPVRWQRRRANLATYRRTRAWSSLMQVRTRLHRTRSPRISRARRRRAAGTRGSPSRSSGGDDPPPDAADVERARGMAS